MTGDRYRASAFDLDAEDLAAYRRREHDRGERHRVIDVDDYRVEREREREPYDRQRDPRPIIDREALLDYRRRVGEAGREGWRELRRVLFWLALAAVIVAALAAFNGRDDDVARSTFSTASLDARDLSTDTLDGWRGIDVDRYGIVRADGEVRGSVWDTTGVEIRDEYLAGLRAGEPIVGDDSALVEDGLKFCALMASGDREALLTAADAGIAARPYGSTPRSVKLAASALVHFCPRFDQ